MSEKREFIIQAIENLPDGQRKCEIRMIFNSSRTLEGHTYLEGLESVEIASEGVVQSEV